MISLVIWKFDQFIYFYFRLIFTLLTYFDHYVHKVKLNVWKYHNIVIKIETLVHSIQTTTYV